MAKGAAATATRVKVQPQSEEELRKIELVDQLGEMAPSVEEAKALIARYEGVRKDLTSLVVKDSDPTQSVTIKGKLAIVKFTPASRVRRLKENAKAVIYRILGNDKFVELADFPTTKISEVLTEDEQAEVFDVSMDGPRRCTVTVL